MDSNPFTRPWRRTRNTRHSATFALIGAMGLASLFVATGGMASDASQTRLLVKFVPGASAQARTASLAFAGARDNGTIAGIGVHVVTGSSANALARLKTTPAVQFAEPDAERAPQELLPSDPSFPKQYAVGGGAWGWYATHTTQAWDVTRGSSSVVIAIIDTGLKTGGLSDYSGQVVSGWNVLNNSSDTSSNAGNHGTYVAGVAGLAPNNGVGNSGFCPGCRIMPVQVGTDSGASDSAIASGIIWAADHGARVANLSWAGPGDSQTIQNAVDYAHSRGVVVVAAAGNGNCDCRQYPAADRNVLGVAGTTSTDAKQGDSNYGSWVTIAAPEGNMTSWPSINGAPGYAPVGGTSLAAPVVAGIAALLFSANPGLTNTQVEQALMQTATPVGFPVATGRVDAMAALNSLGFSDPQPSSLPLSTSTPQIYVETNGDWNYTALGTSAPQAGQVLLRGQGSWTGSAPLSLSALRWLRCDPAGANCTTVGTTAKYTVQTADAGYTLKLSITARNGLGSTTALSALSLPVDGAGPTPPVNTSLPAISGNAARGQTLSSTAGSWSGTTPMTYAYQWQRCDAAGANCAAIASATASSYTLVLADVGSTIRSRVTATNSAGSASATSAQTAVVVSGPPANTNLPAVTGTAQDGKTLQTTDGSWTNSPSSYAYQWLRCDSLGGSCAAISGATASSYTLVSADVGSTIRAKVTATNAAGSASAQSAQTAVVAAAPPANTSPPAVSGSPKPGQTLTSTAGSWSGTTPMTYAYQWLRCDAAGANCAAIPSATASSYTLVSADNGSTIRSRVTASNAAGQASAQSTQTALVTNLQTLTFTGTLSNKTPSLAFPLTIGAGQADATLTFSKAGTMTLALYDGAKTLVGQASGASSPLSLTLPGLAAGQYGYVVSGSGFKGAVSFTLTVTAPSP
jgi:subtilisin family serine protease